jgi:hypothetical protein
MVFSRRPAFAVPVALLVALAAAAVAAAADDYQYRFNRSDSVLARDSVAMRSDLSSSGWRASSVEQGGASCLGFGVKRSDLVVTGEARSAFEYRNVARLETRSEVFATSRMLNTDWQRSVGDSKFAPCVAASVGTAGRLMSLSQLQLPHLAAHTAGWRVVVRTQSNGTPVDVVADLVLCADGRREISLVQTTVVRDAGTVDAMRSAEIRLARALVTRLEV